MNEADELAALVLEAQDLDLPALEDRVDKLCDHLSLVAAETGMDRELDYCPERHMEDVLDAQTRNPSGALQS
jgi:hypothetical protein